MITLKDIKNNKEFNTLIEYGNMCMEAMGYTEHGVRHCSYVSEVTVKILRELGYDERVQELGAIAGWLHDIGNSINRKHHGLTGANLAFPILLKMGMDIEEICAITAAIGNHEEETGYPVSEIASALIIADKSDAHRTRVRRGTYNADDIHDRVNYAIKKSRVDIDAGNSLIKYSIEMEGDSSIMEFMQIYMSRMVMCEKAARHLKCGFQIVANGQFINNNILLKDTGLKEESA